MPIISVEIMKILDERGTQKTITTTNKQTNKQRQKRARGDKSYSKTIRAN